MLFGIRIERIPLDQVLADPEAPIPSRRRHHAAGGCNLQRTHCSAPYPKVSLFIDPDHKRQKDCKGKAVSPKPPVPPFRLQPRTKACFQEAEPVRPAVTPYLERQLLGRYDRGLFRPLLLHGC